MGMDISNCLFIAHLKLCLFFSILSDVVWQKIIYFIVSKLIENSNLSA